MIKKWIAGSDQRKTRLHDEHGNLIPVGRLLRNGPRAIASGVARLAADHRGVRPWISYDAQMVIASHLTTTSRVLEYGSGMSTVWYAERAGEVVSTEDYEPWFHKVNAIIAERGIANIRYRLARDDQDYTTLSPIEQGDGFDLIMIDGSMRDQCAERALGLLRPGSMVYLDNSDQSVNPADPTHGDIPAARQTLLAFAERTGADVRLFTDVAPTQLFVQQGLMITLPKA